MGHSAWPSLSGDQCGSVEVWSASIDSISPLNCVCERMAISGVRASHCVCVSVSVGLKTNGQIHSSHQLPCGSSDSRRTEGDRMEEQGSGFSLLSSGLTHPPFPPSRTCPSHTLPAALALSSQIHRKALIWMEKEAERRRRRPTLTQLVRLMKRIGGPWVRAQTHSGGRGHRFVLGAIKQRTY